MKKYFLFIIAGFLALASCKKSKTDDCTAEHYTYVVRDNAKVDTIRPAQELFASIVAGNKLVFAYEKDHPGCTNIADDELVDVLIFEVELAATEFHYSPANFQEKMVYFRRLCYCPDTYSMLPIGGTIDGTKISTNNWTVSFNLTFPNGRTVSGNGNFHLE